MMEHAFIRLVNMSLTAGYLVLAVILLRLLLRKAPRWISCVLWAFVAVRLVCPFSAESVLSLIPQAEVIPDGILTAAEPGINSGIPIVNQSINPIITDVFAPDPAASANPLQICAAIAAVVWLVGVVLMLAYAALSYLRLRLGVRESVRLHGNFFICDRIPTPFILGVFRPRVYIPSSVGEPDTQYVIMHERAHLRRRDHIWKPLGYLLLSLHWFNPLVWAAYVLLCRDIEIACDEKVIRETGTQIRQPYSSALINCSIRRRGISVCPPAFGEVRVKERVRNVLSYKKPAFWIIIAALVLLVGFGVCFLTDPPASDTGNAGSADVYATVREALKAKGIGCGDTARSSGFLGGETRGLELTGSGEVLTFYVYESPEEAAADSGRVSPDGFSVTGESGKDKQQTTSIGWTMRPHWYLCGNTVICYVGESGDVTDVLDGLGGSCFAGVGASFPKGKLTDTYSCEGEGEDITSEAGVLLYDSGEFELLFSPLSSYVGYGHYTSDGDRLTLRTDDGRYTYVFRIDGDTLVFSAGESTGIFWYSSVEDGSVFRKK